MVDELSFDSEIEDEDQYDVQDKEISSNECAVCFGLYQDDLSSAGKLMRSGLSVIMNSARSGCTASAYKLTMTCIYVESVNINLANLCGHNS